MDPTDRQQHSANIAKDLGIDDLKGRIVTLHTKAEAEAQLQVIDAYVIEVPSKSANDLLK